MISGIIFIIVILFFLILYLVYLFSDHTPDNIKKEIANENDKVSNDIKKIEDIFTKSIAEENSPTTNFFIKAILNNYRYIRMKEHYIKRDDDLRDFVNDHQEYKHVYKINLKELYNTGRPVYSDFSSFVDPKILNLYSQLSLSYAGLGLKLPRFIDTPHKVDISENYFFFAKVGNLAIPQFVSSKKVSKRLYIYPTTAISYDKGGQLDMTDIQNVNVKLRLIKELDIPIAILSIDLLDIEIITKKVDAAQNFYTAFLELQKYENEQEWGFYNQNGEESKKEIEIKNILNNLDNLVGLEKVKSDFYKTADYLKIQQIRKFKGLKNMSTNYHYVFSGNPGTGKTTLARLLAKIYKEMGILKTGQLIETDRSGLVGEYVGQTAVKTNKVIDEAMGGVLFIDEAYSLVVGQNDDFGNESISTLLKRMEDDRDKFVVIIAGYTHEMKKFIDSNPGLQSRFTRFFNFEDYSADELIEIFKRMTKDNDYILTDNALARLSILINNAVSSKDKNFGNARYIRNLFEETLQNQASRLSHAKVLNHGILQTIEAEDLP